MNMTSPAHAVWRAALPTLLVLLFASSAAAATSTWTAAGANSKFSDADNWDAFPTPNCIMVFPAGAPYASKGAPVNDLLGLTIDQLNIYERYVISGNAISCKNINDNSAGIVTVALPISTAGSAVLTVTVTIGGATLNLSGRLSGAGPVTYGGPGIKRLNGTVNNTVSGLSSVALGSLVLDSTASTSIAGPLLINSGGTAKLLKAPEILDTAIVTVDGVFDLSEATGNEGTDTETIGGLRGDDVSAMITLGTRTLGCTGQIAPTVYLGGFAGTGGFRQSASGVQVFSGTSFPYTGSTVVAGGAMHIWGQLLGSPVSVTSGTLVLAADCSVGNVTLSGALSTLSCNETISAMTMHGTTPSLTIGSGSTFEVVTRSPTNYSTVSTAAAAINGAILQVDTAAFSPAPAQVMTIIDNTGPNPVSGTFAGLAQGATVASATNPGTTFSISYTGGTGNDVTLTGVTIAGDITAPAISAVTAGAIAGDTATITWTTDEASSSQVEYGLTTTYGSLDTLDVGLVTSHSRTLSLLAGSTTYHYRVLSRDAAGNLAVGADATFTTAADITVPTVSDRTAGAVTANAVHITWTTDEASDSQVEYGTTAAYGSTTTLDGSLVTAHDVQISGLVPGTLYHYRILSRDVDGNLQTTADDTFTTTSSGGGTVNVAGSNDDDGHCGAGSASGLLAMIGLLAGLLLSSQLQSGRRGRAD